MAGVWTHRFSRISLIAASKGSESKSSASTAHSLILITVLELLVLASSLYIHDSLAAALLNPFSASKNQHIKRMGGRWLYGVLCAFSGTYKARGPVMLMCHAVVE